MNGLLTRLRARAAPVTALLPWLLAVAALVLNSATGRPIWVDEYVHFALAAEPTTADALDMLRQTLGQGSISHGQTGTYMLLDYWLLSLAGADALALRLPSILSAALMFAAAILLFRRLGLSIGWQLAVVLALCGQHLLMYFAQEARPYLPLAAAATAMLAYYMLRPARPRSRGVLALGIAAMLLGVLMHPYFALYWPAMLLVAWVHHLDSTGQRPSLLALVRFANPGLVAAGVAIFLLLGLATWMPGQGRFAYDPFEWMKSPTLAEHFLAYSHWQFVMPRLDLAIGLTVVAVVGPALLPGTRRAALRGLLPPALLILVALGLSVMVSWLSWRVNYWILPRQWVGSVPLTAIGLVWLWAEAARLWAGLWRGLGWLACGMALWIVSAQALALRENRMREARAQAESLPARLAESGCATLDPAAIEAPPGRPPANNDQWVALANRNILCGGPVWPVYRIYYRMVAR